MPPARHHPNLPRIVRRGIVVVALLVIAAYGGILIWFGANEDALLFHPLRGKLAPPPAALDLDSQDVALQSDDGTPLVARLIPPPAGRPAATAGWILYLHGAGGNVGVLGYNEAWAKFRRLGLGVLAVDYRGFGESGGQPSEAGLYRDAAAAYAYLTGRLGVAADRIVIYGYSLGTAVAIDLATRVPAAGLIVEGALLSVPARGAELYPFLPVAWLARNRFASVEKVARVSMPKLFIHAREDTDVPIAHGRRLFELAVPPKYFQDVAGGHRTAHQVDPGFFAAVARFVAGLGVSVVEAGPQADVAYQREIAAWRAKRAESLQADGGWLTVVGLHWLQAGKTRFGSAAAPENDLVLPAHSAPAHAGVLALSGGRVTVVVADRAHVTLRGQPVTTRQLATDAGGHEPDVLQLGTLSLQVIERGGRLGVRIKDARSEARRSFKGLTWYPVNPALRVSARFIPHPTPRSIDVPSIIGTSEAMPTPGRVEFELGGQTLRLTPVLEPGETRLFFVFRDATSGHTTYGGGRFLYADPPRDGQVILDFNQAYSPPCAFTPYATCPLPPPENRLPISIEAGEMHAGH